MTMQNRPKTAAIATLALLPIAPITTHADESLAHWWYRHAPPIEIDDARLKFEINSTDEDGGIQIFLDAEPWRWMAIFDPGGELVFWTSTAGRIGEQGGTELFLEIRDEGSLTR